MMRHVHFIGIGGTGLSAIALALLESGLVVSGSDRQASPLARSVEQAGGTVYTGHSPEHVLGADLVVRSSAVAEDNVEVQAALAAGIPVLKRAEFLGRWLGETPERKGIAVAGTHGKTTTTAMIAWMLSALGQDPSYIIGGVSTNLGRSAHAGRGSSFVIEADEYDRMFLGLKPQIAIITNVEHDHPDCYPTAAEFEEAFNAFAGRLAEGGLLLACAADPGAVRVAETARARGVRTLTYGIIEAPQVGAPRVNGAHGAEAHYPAKNGSRNGGQGAAEKSRAAHYKAINLARNPCGGFTFELITPPKTARPARRENSALRVTVALRVPGEHNVFNALAALAVADELNLPLDMAAKALGEFRGTGRRFEVRGEAGGVTLIDDYAHHPTEIRATLAAARLRYPQRSIWAVWQPHTYSRTRLLMNEFQGAFKDADHVIVTEVFPSREAPPPEGFSAREVIGGMQHGDVTFAPCLDRAHDLLLAHLRPGDVLLVLSAGDAHQISAHLFETLRRRPRAARSFSSQDIERLRQGLDPALGERLRVKEPLARYTAARIGGPVDALLEVRSSRELAAAARALWALGLPFSILGGGSNVLVDDAGVNGVVVLNRARKVHFDDDAELPTVWAESGANLGLVARQAAQRGLSGLEWAAGIPGTIGGAVYGNAGAYGSDMSSCMLLAEILHPEWCGTAPELWTAERLQFGYRSSRLKAGLPSLPPASTCLPHQKAVILAARLLLAHSTPEAVQTRMEEISNHRRSTQPPGASMGSMFKNPSGDYAGRLIEAAGLKGLRVGGAEISTVHANFFVNHGEASASDVLGLIRKARRTVADKFGVWLELEIELLGEQMNEAISVEEGEYRR